MPLVSPEHPEDSGPVDLDLPVCECDNETVIPGTDSCRTCSGIKYTIYGILEKTDGPEDKRGWWIFGVYDDGVAFRNGPYEKENEAEVARTTLYPASARIG